MKLLTTLLLTLAIFAFAGCGGNNGPDVSKAVPYKIIKETLSDPISDGLTRDMLTICPVDPYDLSREQLAQTAIKAAIEDQKKTGSDVVAVFLHQAKDFPYAPTLTTLTYNNSGRAYKGSTKKFDISVAERSYSRQESKIFRAWKFNARMHPEYTPEQLRVILSARLNLPAEKISLDAPKVDEYVVQN